jgi:hypothetical protein
MALVWWEKGWAPITLASSGVTPLGRECAASPSKPAIRACMASTPARLAFGIVGDGTGAAGAGILGRNSGGSGVQGEGGNGVHGKATSGYGGLFEGGKAQLKIAPKGTAGRPTTGAHSKGELYMDSAAALFVCTASGTPGKWRRVTTTAA